MAVLKAKYEDPTEIPEAAQQLELYEEKDGEWLLKRGAIEGVKTDADVKRIEDAAKKERQQRKEAEDKLKEFGERDPEKIREAEEELEQLRARIEQGEGGDEKTEEKIQQRIEAAKEAERRKAQHEIEKLSKERDEFKTTAEQRAETIKQNKVRESLTEAARKAGISKEAIPDALMYTTTFEVTEEDEQVLTRDGVGVMPGMTPEDWFGEMKEKRPHWWPPSEGGGARGNTRDGGGMADNPFSAKHWNRTAQTQMPAEKRDKAAQAAGFKDATDAMMKGPPKE